MRVLCIKPARPRRIQCVAGGPEPGTYPGRHATAAPFLEAALATLTQACRGEPRPRPGPTPPAPEPHPVLRRDPVPSRQAHPPAPGPPRPPPWGPVPSTPGPPRPRPAHPARARPTPRPRQAHPVLRRGPVVPSAPGPPRPRRAHPSSAGNPSGEPAAAPPRLCDPGWGGTARPAAGAWEELEREPGPRSRPAPTAGVRTPLPVPSPHRPGSCHLCPSLSPGVGAEHSAAQEPGLPRVPPHAAPW